jgi:hypothetical protein
MAEISDSVPSIVIEDTAKSLPPLLENPKLPGTTTKNQQDEETLFHCFRGWTYSERARGTTSWIWEQGFDIQRRHEREWVCRSCTRNRDPKPKSVAAAGTQNAENHLWEAHRISDPLGKRIADKKRKRDSKPFQSIAEIFRLDPAKPQEQAIANTIIKDFNRTHFQRLLVEWVVESNLTF